MSDDETLTILDAQKASESLSVAEARHMARTAFLIESLNQINEIATNVENKASDRLAAHTFLVKFAEGADGTDGKFVKKLSPEVARRIARLGVADALNRRSRQTLPSGGNVSQDSPQGERVDSGGADNQGRQGKP